MIAVMDRAESSRFVVASLASVAEQLIRQRDAGLAEPIQIEGLRLGLPAGDRTISTTRIVEDLITSAECRQRLDDGVDVGGLAAWLAEQVLTQMERQAERGFMGVEGITTATQLHDWVDSQLPEDDD